MEGKTLQTNKTNFIRSYVSLMQQTQVRELQKAQLKQLLGVFLYFSTFSGPHDKALLKFCDKYPRNFYWLKYLTFGANSLTTTLTSRQFTRAIKIFYGVKSLTHLKLMAGVLKQANLLAPFLKSQKRIQHLTLDFCYCESLKIPKLFHSLQSLNNLKHLKIVFTGTLDIPNQVIKELCVGLSLFKALDTVYLDFSESTLNLEGDKKAFFLKVGSCKALTIRFYNTGGIDDRVIENISLGLKKSLRLEKFELVLPYCSEITNQGITNFSSCLPKSLKSFRLDLMNCFQVNQSGVQNLLSSLAKISSLKDLSLKFTFENRIKDEGLEYLWKCLDSLKNLESLFLSFWGCNINYTESGLKLFLSQLASKTALKSLMLHFPNCNKTLTDNILIQIGQTLASLKELETFGLDVNRCPEVTDKGINGLFRETVEEGNLEKLQRISLNFVSCPLIDRKAMEKLFTTLEKFKKLRYGKIDVRSCKELKKDEIKKMAPNRESGDPRGPLLLEVYCS